MATQTPPNVVVAVRSILLGWAREVRGRAGPHPSGPLPFRSRDNLLLLCLLIAVASAILATADVGRAEAITPATRRSCSSTGEASCY